MTRAAQSARFIIIVTALLLPSLSLLPLVGLYLWQKGWVLWWALGALVSVGAVVAVQRWLWSHSGETGEPAPVASRDDLESDQPGETWSPIERQAWNDVLAIAKRVEPDRLRDFQAVLTLGQGTIEAVARRLHPGKHDAIWHFTMPEALAISERVSQQLRRYVHENVPFGDRLTVAQVLSIYRWRGAIDVAEKAYDVWRLVRLINPVAAVTNEARERLSKALLGWGREHVTRRLAERYVEEVGRAAIDLYGGRLRIQLDAPSAGARDPAMVVETVATTPVRVLVMGCTPEERVHVAALISLASKVAIETWLAADGTSREPTVYDLEVAESGDGQAAAAVLVAEAEEADIILLLSGRDEVHTEDMSSLSAISRHFGQHPAQMPPVLIPVILDRRGLIENAATSQPGCASLSACYAGTVAPAVNAGCLDTGGDGGSIRASLQRVLPIARRVAVLRQIDRLKRRARWTDAGWQATAAAGSLARAMWRRRGGS